MPRLKKDKKEYHKMNIEIYNKMMAYYTEDQSATYIRKKLEERDGIIIKRLTIEKIVNQGNPRKCWPALRDRFNNIQKLRTKKEDYSIAQFRNELINMCRAFYIQIAKRIRNLKDQDYDKLNPLELAKMFDVVSKNMGNMGFDVSNLANNERKEDPFADWTEDEVKEYVMNHKLPDRLANTKLLN